MAVTITFLAVVLAHFAATAIQVRYGLLLLIFLYGVYPKFLSLGVSDQGFALSGQRAMLYVLLGFYLLRAMWGSKEIRSGLSLIGRYRWIVGGVIIYLGARLVGNTLAGRMDLGSFAAFINESVISLLVIMLVVTYVKTQRDVVTVLALVVAALLLNQFAAIIEFVLGESMFTNTVDIQYQSDDEAKLLQGTVRSGYFRSRGFFDNPLKLTGFLCLALPAAFATAKTSGVFLVRFFSYVCISLAPVTALFTGSRTGIAVTSLIFLWYAYAYLVRGFGSWGRAMLNIGAAVAVVLVITLVATGAAESLFLGSESGRSAESRVLQYVRVPIALAESPFFGFGYARQLVDLLDIGHVDSFFLTTALEGGLVSLGAVLFVMFGLIRMLRKVASNSPAEVQAVIARHLAVSIGFTFLLGLVLSLNHIRFYMFLFIGLAVVLHSLSAQGLSRRSPTEVATK